MLALLTVVVCGLLSSCSDYEPKGYPEVPALATASDLQASVAGRSVTLTWQLPSQQGITAVRVSRDNGAATILPADATSCTLKGQPMDQQLVFTVKVEYDNKYVSEGVSVIASVPYVASKMAYLMTAPTIADLPTTTSARLPHGSPPRRTPSLYSPHRFHRSTPTSTR